MELRNPHGKPIASVKVTQFPAKLDPEVVSGAVAAILREAGQEVLVYVDPRDQGMWSLPIITTAPPWATISKHWRARFTGD